jgi:hypothetical protein
MDTGDADNARVTEGRLLDLLPAAWLPASGDGLASAYRIMGIARDSIVPPVSVGLEDVCVLIAQLGLPILAVRATLDQDEAGQITVSLATGDGARRDLSATSLFITRLQAGENALDEARSQIHRTVGLLSAVAGKLLVYEHIEDYRVSFTTGMLSPTPTLAVDTTWWETIDTSEEARERWRLSASAMLSSPYRNQIELSLRWYDEAKRERGVDAFLKLWFALETLAMPDTTNVSPMRATLREIYPDSADVEREFSVGRVFGLRSKIVHHGVRVDLSTRLLSYIAGLYIDLLVAALGFASPGRARKALTEAGGLQNVLPSIVDGRSELADKERSEEMMNRLQREREQ